MIQVLMFTHNNPINSVDPNEMSDDDTKTTYQGPEPIIWGERPTPPPAKERSKGYDPSYYEYLRQGSPDDQVGFNPAEDRYVLDQKEEEVIIPWKTDNICDGEDMLDFISGALAVEDAYSTFLHNHKTYVTTKGKVANIYKPNGQVNSARAAKFANASKLAKGLGVAGTALSTTVARYNMYQSHQKNESLKGKNVADFTMGAVVSVYFFGSLAYDLCTD